METGQRDKKIYYIAGIVGILVICLLISLLYSNYFAHKDNQVKNDNEVKNQDNTASKNVKEVESTTKTSDVNEVFPPTKCAIKVNALCTLGLLGVYHWFNCNLPTLSKNKEDEFTLNLQALHFILAGVVLCAMVGYISCFVYQNYSFDATRAKDMAILVLGMFVLSGIIIKIFIDYVSRNHAFFPLVISVGFYLGSWLLSMTLPNNKLALLKQGYSSFLQWFCSAFVLVDLYYQIHNIRLNENGVFKFQALLWCIPVAFLCIQNYWSPQLSFSSGYEILDFLIAWPFWTTNLCLVFLFEGLYELLRGKAMSGLVLVWLIISYNSTHLLPPEKATTHGQHA